MIAVDTNVLVRLLVRDDADQVGRALRMLEKAQERKVSCLITAPVLCELVWVLSGVYRVPRREIAEALSAIFEDPAFELDGREAATAALARYRAGRADFADYLVAALARQHGATVTYTFDRALRREPDFTLL